MRVNEIFHSIQGEGRHTGTPAVFIRLAGCNLRCDFCDTEHQPHQDLTEEEIMRQIADFPADHVVIAGGEPMLQLTLSFINHLHGAGKFVQIETNGTIPIKGYCPIDWITCSPKFDLCPHAELRLQRIDELKVVYQERDMSAYDGVEAKEYCLQPCDFKDEARNSENIAATINCIKSHVQDNARSAERRQDVRSAFYGRLQLELRSTQGILQTHRPE